MFSKEKEEHWTQFDWFWVTCPLVFFSVSSTNFRFSELVIFCAVLPQVCGCGFRPDRGLISDVRRASAEVYGEKVTELSNGLSLVFTKAKWFTGAASVSSEARINSCVLNMFLSDGKRPVARQPLASIMPVAARLYAVSNCS